MFADCSNLTSITIPDSVTNIGNEAFSNCNSLTTITIPDGITGLGYRTFYSCSSLTSITLPGTITFIGIDTFGKCYNLSDVYFNGTQAQWDALKIERGNDLLTGATLYCTVNCDNGHHWDDGKVTTPATCKEAGTKTYTCTACETTKTESIAKLTTHTPGAEATETTAQTCTTCGYVIKAALGHTHKYASTWTTDENGHWYACSGCEEKGSYAAHDFENTCDKDCSICGYTREPEHKFTDTWATDADNHWHVCSNCGLKQDEAVHEPGAEATATTAQTCTVCGYEIAPALGIPETTPTKGTAAPTDPSDTTEPTDSTQEDSRFPWWVLAVIVIIAGGVVAGVIFWKKKH